MSNRPKVKPKPPPAVQAYADAYRCTDCRSTTARPRRDHRGLWHIDIRHDDCCPVLAGTVPHRGAGRAAARRAAEQTGARTVYVAVDLTPKEDTS